jgi:hypothetical protein
VSTDIMDCARVEALFVSAVQPSDLATADQIRLAVRQTVRRHGTRGCAALVAYEFGEHPETALARMRWAAATVHATFTGRHAIRSLPAAYPRTTLLAAA